jgi:NAD(P)-dependent dehydrogenase (short-subunit alcohol dehydrogenase family)
VSGLAGRTALVVGASRGIGAGIATRFAAEGATVVLAARDLARLEAVAETIRAAGGTAHTVPTDVTDEASVAELFARIAADLGPLHIAVNNAAGGGRRPAPLADWSVEEFDSAIAVDLRGVFLCLRAEIAGMLDAGVRGSIVNMNSTAGHQGVSGLTGYVASKFGLDGLTRVAALDYAAAGIRVNAIAPGPILTDSLAGAGDEAQARVAASVPLQRVGAVADVAEAALWLASDASAFVTGSTITVDGGRLAGVPAFAIAPRPGG